MKENGDKKRKGTHPDANKHEASGGGQGAMQFETYVCDREICQAFEYLFHLFQKFVMFVQRAQTKVVLSKGIRLFNPLQERE